MLEFFGGVWALLAEFTKTPTFTILSFISPYFVGIFVWKIKPYTQHFSRKSYMNSIDRRIGEYITTEKQSRDGKLLYKFILRCTLFVVGNFMYGIGVTIFTISIGLAPSGSSSDNWIAPKMMAFGLMAFAFFLMVFMLRKLSAMMDVVYRGKEQLGRLRKEVLTGPRSTDIDQDLKSHLLETLTNAAVTFQYQQETDNENGMRHAG
ncbi:hypothetical protein ACXHXG_30355 [Rhizobium sp. LEGMi198b]